MIVLTLIAVLNRFGVETTSLVAVLGAAGLAIGLALQGMLTNVAAGVMILVFRPFNIGDAIQLDGGVFVIDALGSPRLAERLTAEIKKRTSLPISDVILTHYHADHIYGLSYFKLMGAHITAHAAAKEYIQSDTAQLRLEASRTDLAPWIDDKTHLVLADTWIAGPTSLKIGGWVFELDHVGPSHTPEDLTVFVPEDKVLFAGDLFFNGRLPFVGKANSSQWILSLDQMLQHDAKTVVPGHGPASTNPKKDIGMTRDYLKYLRASMGAAVQDFVPFEEAYKVTDWTAFEAMPMFGFANRMNAYNTYLLMEEEALEKKR